MSSNNIAIRVDHLGKKYQIGGPQEQYHTFRDAIVNSLKAPFKAFHRAPPDEGFWALKDVSFDVEQGEVVGIIGQNGAGKSTLLKILSRITTPTKGTVEIHGRVGSLLEVGTGFHPEMTGRENISLNGLILGMKKIEIEQKFDEIVKFADIDKFIDTPVKRYSSGMFVRLAFAVAAHLEPDILVVDEVLAVGDFAFQKKCLGKMKDVAKGGRTVLFVSHNMGAIRSLCENAILLDKGKIMKKGTADEVVREYIKNQTEIFDESSSVVERDYEVVKNKSFYFIRVEMLNAINENTNIFKYNDELVLIVSLGGEPDESFSVEFHIYNELGQYVSSGSSGAYHGIYFNKNIKKVRIRIGPLALTSGKYSISLSLVKGIDGAGISRTDTWQNACAFTIVECKPFTTHWEIPAFREGVCVLQQSFSEVE